MQTFLPHQDFSKTASRLDRKRLIKQSVENLQVLKSLAGLYSSGAWKNHPAVKMWDGHEDWLFLYNESIVKEILDERVHYSHRGRLYEKDPDKYYFYSEFADYKDMGYTCCESCNYYWPTHSEAL